MQWQPWRRCDCRGLTCAVGLVCECSDDCILFVQDKKQVAKEALAQLSDKQQQLERYIAGLHGLDVECPTSHRQSPRITGDAGWRSKKGLYCGLSRNRKLSLQSLHTAARRELTESMFCVEQIIKL